MSKQRRQSLPLIFNFLVLFWVLHYASNAFIYPNNTELYEGSACTYDDLDGICVKASDCAIDTVILKYTDLCSFTLGDALYCCVNPVQILQKLRPADRICNIYYPRDQQTFESVFVGGVKSLADQHPHMAAIGWTSDDGTINWRCGGSVVTSNFIITAAHCTSYGGKPPDIARTGDLNLLVTENNTKPQDFQITEIYNHPQYKSSEAYHDVALLKISPDFRKRPACLWSKYEIPKQIATGMGYGTREFSGPQSNELYEGTLNLLSNEECVKNVPITPDIPNGLISQQLCAQDPQHEKDTCQGDSGGPLQFKHKEVYSMRPVIVGITSFGQNCAGSTPGIYTRVSEYIDWIEAILLTDFHNASSAEMKGNRLN